jgi:hypothetical protein
MPSEAKIASKVSVNFASRSRMRNLTLQGDVGVRVADLTPVQRGDLGEGCANALPTHHAGRVGWLPAGGRFRPVS